MVPVEPISLTIGAVALASLFSLCVECFDLIELGRNLGSDFELLVIKLSIEKRRLMIWGEAVGILSPDDNRDPLLDESETRQLVEQILTNISKLFNKADALQTTYGLEAVTQSGSARRPKGTIVQGSVVCADAYESSEVVKFQSRFEKAARSKQGLVAKTKWAVRDSKKCTSLIENLKGLVDGLGQITTSTFSGIVKSDLIRQETNQIHGLRALQVIEETCSEAEWRSNASTASAYLRQTDDALRTNDHQITAWIDKQPTQTYGFLSNGTCSQQYGHRHPPTASIFSDSEHTGARIEDKGFIFQGSDQSLDDALILESGISPKLPVNPRNDLTKILVLCSNRVLHADTPVSTKPFTPVGCIPDTTSANKKTASRLMKAIRLLGTDPCISIYCPPCRQYLHMALALLKKVREMSCRVNIRFDDSLQDNETSVRDDLHRMQGYIADIDEAQDLENRMLLQPLLDAVDVNWLEQRVEVLNELKEDSCDAKSKALSWGLIFQASQDDRDCASIIILGSKNACHRLLNEKPVFPPDTFKDDRVYRLRALPNEADAQYRWKAEHYCNVPEDKL